VKATERFRQRLHEATRLLFVELRAELEDLRPTSNPRKRTAARGPVPAPPSLHLSPPSPAVEQGEVIAPAPSNGSAKPEPTSQNGKHFPKPQALPISPKPPGLIGMPRAPLVGAGRGRTTLELSEVGRRGAEAARTARAIDRALGPAPKLSTSDDELEAWCREMLEAGISGQVPLSMLEGPEVQAPPAPAEDEEDV
jgi:hypothetical protein